MNQYKPENYIFDLDSRVPEEELCGDGIVLNSPVIEKAFQFILNDYVPKHDKVIFSLCTASRPYLKSRKWQVLNDTFGEQVDLIVCSNGGIIPLEYMNCYPFMTYDAPHETEFDELYKQVFIKRLTLFLDKFKYKKVVFLFSPNTRNYQALIDKKFDCDSVLYPTEEMWQFIQDKKDLYIGISRRYCIVSYCVLKGIENFLDIQSKHLLQLVSYYTKCNLIPMHDIILQVCNGLDTGIGYTLEQLKEKIKIICPLYSDVYMEKTIRTNTDNIETHFGLVKQNLFHRQDGLFYKYNITGDYPVVIKKLF